ncbi:hypothetical protein [Paenibacillus sp. SYP-B3998]|uniref:hypothetical protein n=1 Tax=Paenibacillus sp. SYP-B3998 TaxID=2678564 RepID=UPI001F07172A|nr:hypothetical protein [Paenibacillus sp. SYP-B3998]
MPPVLIIGLFLLLSSANETLDAALVCPGERRLLQFDHSLPPLTGGMHVNLHNNVWVTNFPAWYEDGASSDSNCILDL